MPSTNKTPNLGLSQFVSNSPTESDQLTHQDYNSDMSKIDASIMAVEIISATRDLSLQGSQVVTTATNRKIKALHAIAAIPDTLKYSHGFADSNGARSLFVLSNAKYNAHNNSLLMFSENMTADRAYCTVILGIGSFTLSWAKTGAGATGTAALHFLVYY